MGAQGPPRQPTTRFSNRLMLLQLQRRSLPSRSTSIGPVRYHLTRAIAADPPSVGTSKTTTTNVTTQRMCSACRSRHTCSFLKKAEMHTGPRIAFNQPDVHTAYAPERSHHQRTLPDGLVAFKGSEGRRRFAKSMEAGHAEAYFPLSEQFVTQSEVAFCG